MADEGLPERSLGGILIFFSIVSVMTSLLCGFIGVILSLIYTPGSTISIWFILGGIGFGFLLFVLQLVTHIYHSRPMMPLYLAGSIGLAVFFYMFLISLIAGIMLTVLLIFKISFHEAPFAVQIRFSIPVLMGIILTWGLINARHLKRTKLRLDILDEDKIPMKIALMSDIHLGLLVGKKRMDAIHRTLRQEGPDLIIIAGDLLDTDPRFLGRFEHFMKEMVEMAPVYAVMGNHEFYNGLTRSVRWLKDLGVNVLDNRVIRDHVTGLEIIGVNDPSAFVNGEQYREKILELTRSSKGGAARVLVNHQPLYFRESVENGIDLQLSGHTHAGQIWPFSLATKALFKEGDRGLHGWKGSYLYVCTGTGTWGPPMRIGTSSEMVLIELIKRKS